MGYPPVTQLETQSRMARAHVGSSRLGKEGQRRALRRWLGVAGRGWRPRTQSFDRASWCVCQPEPAEPPSATLSS